MLTRQINLEISNGSLEALKWIALISMTFDHINLFLFNGQYATLFKFGRISFPIFGFVFAYNLARPVILQRSSRLFQRLFVLGIVCHVLFLFLGKPLLELNILFTLGAAGLCVWSFESIKRPGSVFAACGIFLIFGKFVDYSWVGVAYVICCFYLCKKKTVLLVGLWFLVFVGLFQVNRNLYALCAIPIIFLATKFLVSIPRSKWLFYAYYPVHLVALIVTSAALK